ncbi:hypothetical protein Mal15_06310 [Stieleria maiorica]|uniref:Uncharacterized protein n=1 Tax=Stieleria maiorica TaxID=2795974 RepID=A0A5B9M7G2_9BACT|nr:hypothetical protein [Stieleria maiorica]QEF96603.1 hypothetical protein Mal15_06310 [Stieleria maiorica]
MTEATPRRPRLQPRLLCGVVLIHAVAYWALVFQWQYVDQIWRVIALGIVLGQGSLLAMMAMLFARSIPVRVALPLSASLGSWYGLAKIAQWGFGDPGATWWAIAIAIQTIVCVAGAEVMREKVRHHFAAIADAAGTREPPLQFPIRSLIALTTMSAIGFAVIRYGQRSGWWSPESMDIDENLMMAVVGLILAAAALMVVFGFLSRRTHVIAVRMAAVIASVPVMGYLLHAGAVRAGLSGGSDLRLTIVMLTAHVACILITWVIVYRLPPYPASFSTNGMMSDS